MKYEIELIEQQLDITSKLTKWRYISIMGEVNMVVAETKSHVGCL